MGDRRLTPVRVLSAVAVGVVVASGATLATLTTDTPPAPQPLTPPFTTPAPTPLYGARVLLGGLTGANCTQRASVTVRTTTKGLLLQRTPGMPGRSWVTKVESLDPPPPAGTLDTTPPTPPILKGRMDAGWWIILTQFTRPQSFRVYYANDRCWNVAHTGARWNATIVTVSVVQP